MFRPRAGATGGGGAQSHCLYFSIDGYALTSPCRRINNQAALAMWQHHMPDSATRQWRELITAGEGLDDLAVELERQLTAQMSHQTVLIPYSMGEVGSLTWRVLFDCGHIMYAGDAEWCGCPL